MSGELVLHHKRMRMTRAKRRVRMKADKAPAGAPSRWPQQRGEGSLSLLEEAEPRHVVDGRHSTAQRPYVLL